MRLRNTFYQLKLHSRRCCQLICINCSCREREWKTRIPCNCVQMQQRQCSGHILCAKHCRSSAVPIADKPVRRGSYRVTASQPTASIFQIFCIFFSLAKTNKLICGTHFCNSCFVLCINETFPTSADKRYSHTAPSTLPSPLTIPRPVRNCTFSRQNVKVFSQNEKPQTHTHTVANSDSDLDSYSDTDTANRNCSGSGYGLETLWSSLGRERDRDGEFLFVSA